MLLKNVKLYYMKTRNIRTRLIRLKDSNDNWDLNYWQSCSVTTRFAAAWSCVLDYLRITKHKNETKPRLQRHITNIQRLQS